MSGRTVQLTIEHTFSKSIGYITECSCNMQQLAHNTFPLVNNQQNIQQFRRKLRLACYAQANNREAMPHSYKKVLARTIDSTPLAGIVILFVRLRINERASFFALDATLKKHTHILRRQHGQRTTSPAP